jgi:ATP-dependent protease ClpP protease subunit
MLKVDTQTGEIFVYDVIGANWYGDGITALNMADALKAISDKKAILRINSPGGSADEGIAIYNLLKRHAPGVETHNDALAASAASVIFLSGEKRYAAKGSRVMIHRASSVVWGNSIALAKEASTLDVYDRSQCEIYCEHMDKTTEETMALLDAETWYTSEEAVAAGLATSLTETVQIKPNVAAWFRNAPKSLAEDVKRETSPSAADTFARWAKRPLAAEIAKAKSDTARLTR